MILRLYASLKINPMKIFHIEIFLFSILPLLCSGCYSDSNFPERIEFPAEGGQIKVYSDYNHFKITFRDSNAPIGINEIIQYNIAGLKSSITATIMNMYLPLNQILPKKNGK